MNIKTLTKSTVVLALALSATTACSDDDSADPTLADQTTPGTVANFLASDPRFSVVAEVANQTGLLSQLDTLNGITVFAPTDAAFNALPDGFLVTQNFVSAGDPSTITSSISSGGLTTLLQAHVVSQDLSAADVEAATSLDSLAGSAISVQMGAGGLILRSRAQILEADVALSNGTVHVIDTVFVPTTELATAGEIDEDAFPGTLFELLEATPLFRTVLQALQDGSDFDTDHLVALADGDMTQTVFVPIAGVADAPDGFFDVHVYPGELTAAVVTATDTLENAQFAQLTVDSSTTPVTVEGTNIFATDVRATNGVVHLVEEVIPFPRQSAADVITTTRSFRTFGAALNMVDADGAGAGTDTLLDTLRGDGDTFTVLAPNNAAFDALATLGFDTDNDPASTFLDELLMDEASLSAVLQYHLAMGVVDPTTSSTVTTLLGEVIEAGTLGGLRVLNELIELIGDGAESTGNNDTVVYELGNALIPNAAGLVRPQIEFPGPTSTALAYFSAFSEYNTAAGETDVPFNATVAGGASTAPFAGTLADIFRFVDGDDSLLVEADDANFAGELVAPFAVDTDDDDATDANLEIETTTLFVPLNGALPEEVDEDVIPYHAAFGTFLSTGLMTGMVPTLTVDSDGNTGNFSIDLDVSGAVTLNGSADVILPDLITDNGVIHVISEALVLPSSN